MARGLGSTFKFACGGVEDIELDAAGAGAGIITKTAHGLSNGDQVIFLPGETVPSGLSTDTIYYVVNADTNTLRLSATKGGAGIVFGSATFDVTDVAYGATGDGSTDDTAAIRTAMAAADSYAATNGAATLYFPAGTYNVVPGGNGITFEAAFNLLGSNVAWLGESRDNTKLQLRATSNTSMETNWIVQGTGNGIYRIYRGGMFSFEDSTGSNTSMRELHLDGGVALTDDFTSGGTNFPCTVASNVFTSAGHGLSNDDILKFGSGASAEINDGTTGYYVIGVTTDTFQISDTQGGAAKTVTDEATTFYACNGDGWDLTNKCVFRADSRPGFSMDNCKVTNFAAEQLHGGGDGSQTVTLTDTIFDGAKGSMISMSSVVATGCAFRNAYAGFECYARESGHTVSVTNCTFENTSGFGLQNGLVYIGSNVSTCTVSGCTFSGYSRHIYLAEWCTNVTISGNTFSPGSGETPILASYVGLYGGDLGKGWEGFDDITVSGNTFNPVSGAGVSGNLSYWQINFTRNNFIFENNSVIKSGSDQYQRLIEETGTDSIADRSGSYWRNNTIESQQGVSLNVGMARDIWENNTYNAGFLYGDKTDVFGGTSKTITPGTRKHGIGNYSGGSLAIVITTGVFPSGFNLTLENFSGSDDNITLAEDSGWNTWSGTQTIAAGATLELQFDGTKWGLA